MSKFGDVDFEVRWYPFQLNPNAPDEPTSRMQGYMNKFGKSKAEIQQMASWMGGNFSRVGLPYSFTDAALSSNTFEAHRLLAAAFQSGGAPAQDKAAEVLFHGFFAEERAPNDPELLQRAAEAAGLDGKAFLSDPNMSAAEAKDEFKVGKQLRVTGVPHFVISAEGSGSAQQISGAQPPEEFIQAFGRISKPSADGPKRKDCGVS